MDKTIKNWLKKLKVNESTISMILGVLVVVVVGILIFNYFTKEESQKTPIEETASEIKPELAKEKSATTLRKHQVKIGESLWEIAINYYDDGYKWPEIAKANKLSNPDLITAGQELILPNLKAVKENIKETKQTTASITGGNYTVKKGDCLWFIALRAYGDPYKWPEIAKANKLSNPDLIFPGNKFILPR